MVEAVFHFLEIRREVVLGDSTIIIQEMLGKRPKSFDSVDLAPRLGEFLLRADCMVDDPRVSWNDNS